MVRMSDTAYSVEAFQLVREPGKAVVLRLEGWFVSASPIQAMQLVIPGNPGHNIGVTDMRRPSGGLIGLHGAHARNARFKHEARFDDAPDNLADARLMVLLGNVDMAIVAVGQSLSESDHLPAPSYTDEDRALLARFESLGDNCEFGLMQRAIGPERLGLLRLAGARNTARLVEAIENGFEGFATGDDLMMSTHGTEWIASSRRYGFTFHTGVDVSAMAEAEIRAAQSNTLGFMAAKLDEDVRTGRKLFVRRVNEGDGSDGMIALHDALARRGNASLLWVTAATREKPHALVEHVSGRLFRGYHRELADYATANIFYPDPWLEVLRAAEPLMTPPPAALQIGRRPSWPLDPSLDPPPPPPKKTWFERLLKL